MYTHTGNLSLYFTLVRWRLNCITFGVVSRWGYLYNPSHLINRMLNTCLGGGKLDWWPWPMPIIFGVLMCLVRGKMEVYGQFNQYNVYSSHILFIYICFHIQSSSSPDIKRQKCQMCKLLRPTKIHCWTAIVLLCILEIMWETWLTAKVGRIQNGFQGGSVRKLSILDKHGLKIHVPDLGLPRWLYVMYRYIYIYIYILYMYVKVYGLFIFLSYKRIDQC